MSLRARFVMSMLTVLLLAVALSTGSILLNGRRQVSVELATGLAVARASAVADLALADPRHPQPEIAIKLVRTFDGSRHVQAALLDANGQIILRSVPYAAARPAPAWLVWLLDPELPAVSLSAGVAGQRIVLRAVARNESAEVWTDIENEGLFVLVLSLPMLVLLARLTGWILAPLPRLSAAMAKLRSGQGGGTVAVSGPRELQGLTAEFNAMVAALARQTAAAARLEAQVSRIQAEERAEIARDLHDDIGPLLFLIKIDLAALLRLPDPATNEETCRTVRAAIDHLTQIQISLRDILSRLQNRPAPEMRVADLAENLLTEWQGRFPRVRMRLDSDNAHLFAPPGLLNIAERVMAEALNNVFQHAEPSHVTVRLAGSEAEWLEITVENDGAVEKPDRPGSFGLKNMRARVEACGGKFTACCDSGIWTVRAVLPIAALRMPA